MSIYKNTKANRRIKKFGSESVITGSQSGVNPEALTTKISIDKTIASKNLKVLASDIIPLVYAMRKYMKEDVEKAEWWFKTKIKPVLAQIEVLKESNA